MKELRQKFFDLHTEKDSDGVTRVTTLPHNLFEWFKKETTAIFEAERYVNKGVFTNVVYPKNKASEWNKSTFDQKK